MNLKKILASISVGTMILTMTPIASNNFDISTTVEAAKGGAKLSIPKSAPKVNIQKAPSTSNSTKTPAASSNPTKPAANESKSVSGNGKEYKPSKSAKELPNTAPATKSNTAASKANAQTNANTSSTFGNTLRNIGLFAGGMMLGGLIGSLLGDLGGGFLGDVLGLLFNIAIFYALYRGGRYLWDKFKGRNNQSQNKANDFQPIDITPPQASNYPNKSTIGMDYEAKRAADYYRQL